MRATFVELPPFERHRQEYLSDDDFQRLQALLLGNPEAGSVIPGTGGLRKLRYGDARRGKGKRGGAEGDLLLARLRLAILAFHALR